MITAKLVGVFKSLRFTNLIWKEVIAPTTMILLISGFEVRLMTYLLAIAALFTFHAGHIFFNDICDVEVDRLSSESKRNQRAFVLGILSKREMASIGWFFIILSIIFALMLPRLSLLIGFVGSLFMYAYSFGPLHLSARPLVTQIFWSFTWILTFFFCVVAVHSNSWTKAVPYMVFVILFMGIGQSITKDIRDADNDAEGGRKTTIVKFGVPRTAISALIVQFLSVPCWIWFMNSYPLSTVPGVLALIVIMVWLFYFFRITFRLQKSYTKSDARMTHVGSNLTFTSINLIIISSLLFGI